MLLLPSVVRAPHLRLCWIRESRPGYLAADFASTTAAELGSALIRLVPEVSPHALLPARDRILDALPPREDAQVHLPLCDRSNWSRREEVFCRTAFETRGASLVPQGLPAVALNRYYARLLAVAAYDPCAPVSLDAGGERIPAGLFSIWRALPNERRAAYFHFLAPATAVLQSTLREMVEQTLFANLDHFTRPDLAIPALVYIASAPFPGRGRADFTYDLMRNRWLLTAFRLARRPPRRLAAATARDVPGGRPRGPARVVCRCRRPPDPAPGSAPAVYARSPSLPPNSTSSTAWCCLPRAVRGCESAHALARLTSAFFDQLVVRLHRFRLGRSQPPHPAAGPGGHPGRRQRRGGTRASRVARPRHSFRLLPGQAIKVTTQRLLGLFEGDRLRLDHARKGQPLGFRDQG